MKAQSVFPMLAVTMLLTGCDTSSNNDQSENEMAHAGPTMNFHRIGPKLATGGHFTDEGSIATLADQGVTLIIDLRDEPPEGQEARLADADIRWVNVPVAWEDPKLEDFTAFRELMSENQGEHVLVQCQANYRASAMTYAYRVSDAGVPESEAREHLEAIWTPEGTWEAYINEIFASSSD